LIQNERACVKYTIPTNNNLTDISIAHLQKLFKHVYAYPTDVQILYTTNGPGSSFTGCRIATILAQVFLLVNNVSVKTISTLLLQANVPNCLSLLDARNEHRYYGVIKNNKLIKDGLIKQNEVDKLLKDNVLKDVVCDYQNVDIYECVCKHLSDFSSGIKFPNYLKGISTTI
jgi:tRNA A37 threonylcarbamoyladenosine modification protein TsaB